MYIPIKKEPNERIYGSDIERLSSHHDEIIDFTCVDEEIITYDPGKNMVEYRIVLERDSDGKFFQGEYCRYNDSGDSWCEMELEEVFPKTITTVEYTSEKTKII